MIALTGIAAGVPLPGTLIALRAAIDLGRVCCVASEAADRGDESKAIGWALDVGLEPGAVVHGVRLFRGRSPVIGWDDEYRLLEALGRASVAGDAFVAAAARILKLRHRRGARPGRVGVSCDGVAAFLRGIGRTRPNYDAIIRALLAQAGRERVGTRVAESLRAHALILIGEADEDVARAVLHDGIERASTREIEKRLLDARTRRSRTSAFFQPVETLPWTGHHA